MATIKEAVRNASAFAVETLGSERTAGLRLEEVESATIGGEEAWLITLSMRDLAPKGLLDLSIFPESTRDYKIFTVLKKNGEVISMKIRELAAT